MSDPSDSKPNPTIDDYLRDAVAPRFAELVRGAEQRLAAAQREVDDLRAAGGTMAWDQGTTGTHLSFSEV